MAHKDKVLGWWYYDSPDNDWLSLLIEKPDGGRIFWARRRHWDHFGPFQVLLIPPEEPLAETKRKLTECGAGFNAVIAESRRRELEAMMQEAKAEQEAPPRSTGWIKDKVEAETQDVFNWQQETGAKAEVSYEDFSGTIEELRQHLVSIGHPAPAILTAAPEVTAAGGPDLQGIRSNPDYSLHARPVTWERRREPNAAYDLSKFRQHNDNDEPDHGPLSHYRRRYPVDSLDFPPDQPWPEYTITIKEGAINVGWTQDKLRPFLDQFFDSSVWQDAKPKKPIRIADETTLDPRHFHGRRWQLPDIVVMWSDDAEVLVDLEADWIAFGRTNAVRNPLIDQKDN